MIVGIGTDVVMLSRMQSLYDKWGERIAQRILGFV
ncbi:MAG: 4'-phosphopantetheinyl transferase, partial [Betaproteobacteria bacterium]|nr:4'-phosphopantetheinyl transferase [Betaproteobacteria bacterium]